MGLESRLTAIVGVGGKEVEGSRKKKRGLMDNSVVIVGGRGV